MTVRVLVGDCRETLATLPAGSVHCIVTSPPYYGLRDYGEAAQIGLEDTPDAYVAEMVGVFRELRRVLREDGVAWLNLGDSYSAAGRSGGGDQGARYEVYGDTRAGERGGRWRSTAGIDAGNLLGIPWRVAFALQSDGWTLRDACVWHKPNPMPESVRDRCTKAHEYIFMLSKSQRYYFDAEAIKEPVAESSVSRLSQPTLAQQAGSARVPGKTNGNMKAVGGSETRNRRSVWTVTTKPFKGAHFATFPPELVRRCLQASLRPGDAVLDPFGGAGTTGLVADKFGADCTLIEINPEYCNLIRSRLASGLVQLDRPAEPTLATGGLFT